MIKAVLNLGASTPPALFLGLDGENVTRLMADEPILVNAAALGLPALSVVLAGARTAGELIEAANAAGVKLSRAAPADRPSDLAYATAVEVVTQVWPGLDLLPRAVRLALDIAAKVDAGQVPHPTITCPVCTATSANLNDVREGYCGKCCSFTGSGRAAT